MLVGMARVGVFTVNGLSVHIHLLKLFRKCEYSSDAMVTMERLCVL